MLAGIVALATGLFRLKKVQRCLESDEEVTGTSSTVLSSSHYLSRIIAVNGLTFLLLFALEGFNSTIIPLYGANELNLQPAYLGDLLAWVAIIRLFASFYGGVLSDRHGRGTILIPTLLMSGIGATALMFAQNVYIFIVLVAFFAVGRMGNNLNLSLLADVTPPDKLGNMIGINRFIADIGLTLGPWLLALLLDKTDFVTVGLVVGSIACLMALLVWVFFGKGMKSNSNKFATKTN